VVGNPSHRPPQHPALHRFGCQVLYPAGSYRSYVGSMNLDLTDDEAAALTQELHDIVENDRYPFSPRIRTLRGILAKLRPEPVRKPLPPLKVYAPPSKGRYRRRV
jgi:hypothetical protein